MANRVLAGNHPNYGYGLFVSKPGENVLSNMSDQSGVNNAEDAIIDSSSPSIGQVLFTKTLSASSGSVTQDFANHGSKCFAVVWFHYAQGTPDATNGFPVDFRLHTIIVATNYDPQGNVKCDYVNATTGRLTFTQSSATSGITGATFAVFKEAGGE